MSTRVTTGWLCGLVAVTALAMPAGAQPDVFIPAARRGLAKAKSGPAGAKAGKSGLHIPQGKRVNFTTYLNDGAGFRWDIQHYLNIGQGTNYAYGSGVYCQINGTNVSSNGRGWMNAAGDEIEIGPWSRGSYQVYRRCKIYKDQGLARWLDIFVNNTNSPQTVPVRVYTNTNYSPLTTWTNTGAGSFGAKDWAFITTPPSGRTSLLHIVCGAKSKFRPTVQVSNNQIYVNYSVTVPAKGTAVLCYFEAQGHTPADLKKRLKKFHIRKALSDLSPSVRKLIVNFRFGFLLEGIELERSGTSDTVVLRNGDSIFGRITNKEFTIEAFYGTLKLPAEEVIGFAAVPGREDLVRAVLVGGQVITGQLTSGRLIFSLPTGGGLEVPFAKLAQCSYQVSKSKPDETPLTDPLIMLRTGDRLAFDPALLKCSFMTRHGKIDLVGKDLLAIRLQQAEGGVHRAVFLNGSTLAGLLQPEKIVLPLRLGPKLDIARDMILSIRFAEETREDSSLAAVYLSNEDQLFGRLVDKEYTVTTEFGTVKIKPANVVAMSFEKRDPSQVVISLWNESKLRGRLEQKSLRFAIDPGPELDLHVGHIVGLSCPEALPPDEVVKQVKKYIAMLSAASYKDREEAQEALIRMGKSIVPLLRKHVKDPDPEVRQRVGVILEKLGAGPTASSPPPPGAHKWVLAGG